MTTRRTFINVMVASGVDELSELYDSWDEEVQRAFVCKCLCERWDLLTAAQKVDEISKMPHSCHRCRARAAPLFPDAGMGFTKLMCNNCALKDLLDGSADDNTMTVSTCRSRRRRASPA